MSKSATEFDRRREQFLLYLKVERNASRHTIDNYRRDILQFAAETFEDPADIEFSDRVFNLKMAKRYLGALDKLDLHLDKNNGVARLLKIRALPTTIIFDAKGREVGRMEAAAEWDSKEAYSLIQYFIKNPNHTDKLQKKIVTKGAPLSQKAIALDR